MGHKTWKINWNLKIPSLPLNKEVEKLVMLSFKGMKAISVKLKI